MTRKKTPLWPFVPLLLLGGAGCESDDAGEGDRSGAPPVEKAVPASPVEAQDDVPTAEGGAGAGAASAVEPVAPDSRYCEHAHTSFVTMLAEMKKKGQPGRSRVPNKAAFLEACGELPARMQRCMMVGYAARHQDECERVKEGLDDEMIARVQRALEGSPD